MNSEIKTKARAIFDLINQSKRILLICHEGPDGDALGSMLAFFLVLRLQLRKEVVPFCVDLVPENLKFLPSAFEIKNKLDFNQERFDLVIFLDAGDYYHTGLKEPLEKVFGDRVKTINIDHHHDNSINADLNLILPASATTEITFRLFQEWQIKITSQIATCLLAGVYTDTGSLQYDNTTPDTFRVASELILKGARLNLINRNVFHSKPISRLRLWGRALARIKRNQEKGINVSVITEKDLEECGANREDLEGVVSVINMIPDTKASILLSQKEQDEVKGSIRTDQDNIDVSLIASLFGGGGHKKASGFSIPGKLERTGEGGWRIVR